jgi:hypothetical protein
MSIATGQLVVTTTRQQIDGTDNNPFLLIIHNSGTNAVYIGDESVTKDNGFNIHANSTIQMELPPLTALYAVAASGTHEISWIRISK